MDGKFNTKEFKSQIRKLFENEDLEDVDSTVTPEDSQVETPSELNEPAGIEKEELSAIGGISDASSKIADAAATLKAVEDLEGKGIVSGEGHEVAEADALSELDSAIDELIAAKEEMQNVEAKEEPETSEVESPEGEEDVESKIATVDDITSDEEKEETPESK